jgi:hypothetical protein
LYALIKHNLYIATMSDSQPISIRDRLNNTNQDRDWGLAGTTAAWVKLSLVALLMLVVFLYIWVFVLSVVKENALIVPQGASYDSRKQVHLDRALGEGAHAQPVHRREGSASLPMPLTDEILDAAFVNRH